MLQMYVMVSNVVELYTFQPSDCTFRNLEKHHENIPIYNFDPLKPHFYIVKLGFTGVYIIFLISAQKHRLWVLVEAVLRSTHNLCFEQKYEKYLIFFIWKFSFFDDKIFIIFELACFRNVSLLFHSKSYGVFSFENTQIEANIRSQKQSFSWLKRIRSSNHVFFKLSLCILVFLIVVIRKLFSF